MSQQGLLQLVSSLLSQAEMRLSAILMSPHTLTQVHKAPIPSPSTSIRLPFSHFTGGVQLPEGVPDFLLNMLSK